MKDKQILDKETPRFVTSSHPSCPEKISLEPLNVELACYRYHEFCKRCVDKDPCDTYKKLEKLFT